MPAAVSLAKLVSALQLAGPGAVVRIDTLTGDVVDSEGPEAPSQPDQVSSADQSERYRTIALTVDEREFARRFCESISDSDDRRRLETALSTGEPIEAFERALYRSKIAHAWFPFRELQLGSLAKELLEAKGILFVDDLA
jgi:hypothetical protein